MKKLISTIFLLSVVFCLSAQQSIPSEVLRAKWYSEEYDEQPVYTKTVDGSDVFYVFDKSDNSGFVILSTDDVIGYSDNNRFDINNLPPQMAELLDVYSDAYDAITEYDYANIEPFVHTKWGQEAPYNLLCPDIRGEKSVTGCGATAVAQCLKVFEYPDRFDWSNMLDDYSDGYSDMQANAVAELIYDCGDAMDMTYGVNASGCKTEKLFGCFTETYGYDYGNALLKPYHTTEEWNDIVHTELSNNRPVLYVGFSNKDGHTFVCDGYSDGLYHINWGWNGVCDGYYSPSLLNPNTDDGYNNGQRILVGIQPMREGSQKNPIVYVSGDFDYTKDYYRRDVFISFKGGIFSFSPYDFNAASGIKCTTLNNEVFYVECYNNVHFTMGYNVMIYFNAGDLPVGGYYMTPAYKFNGEWRDAIHRIDIDRKIFATVTNDGVWFSRGPTSFFPKMLADMKNIPVYINMRGVVIDNTDIARYYILNRRLHRRKK